MKLIWLILILLCAGCTVTHQPAQAAALATAGGNAQPQVITPALWHRGVTWDYACPMPAVNIAFDVETSTNLLRWDLRETTNHPPVLWESPNPVEFVRVGAHWIDPDLAY
jgi:hypothetical protein